MIVGQQLRDRGGRLDALRHQIQSARSMLDHRRGLRADGADAGAHVRHRAADERHPVVTLAPD